MTNFYWPVYKNLETEVAKLTYDIHIDDNQLCVYSSKISDLILRASAEIESLAKDLYKSNGGSKTEKIVYDADGLKHLNDLWKLDKKVVLISSANCFQSIRELRPFEKNEKKTSNEQLTFSWNNAYQNLKHDRVNSLKFGSLKYLFDIMSALFVLNLYFKKEVFELKKDANSTNFPINMGSELFAIKIHKWTGYDGKGKYHKGGDYDECIYLTKYTDESLENYIKTAEDMQVKQKDVFFQHPKFLNYLKSNNVADYKGQNLMWDVLGKDDYINLIRSASVEHIKAFEATEYEAVLNTNCL